MDETSHPRYRDNEDSRFYKTDRLSPEETWRVLRDELGSVLMDAQRAFWRGRLELHPERVRWWHGAIFARHFPHTEVCAAFNTGTDQLDRQGIGIAEQTRVVAVEPFARLLATRIEHARNPAT